MTRIDPVDPASLGTELRDLLERLPDLPHFGLLAHASTAFGPRLAYGRVLMRDLSLDDGSREAAILCVAGWTDCAYVIVQHRDVALAAELTPEEAGAALRGDADGLSRPVWQAVVRFVAEMLNRRGASAEAVADLRRQAGDRGVIETGLLVERYLGLCLLLNSLGIAPVAPVELHDPRPSSH
jgi:4-carboxymuconolactone decarboxylase